MRWRPGRKCVWLNQIGRLHAMALVIGFVNGGTSKAPMRNGKAGSRAGQFSRGIHAEVDDPGTGKKTRSHVNVHALAPRGPIGAPHARSRAPVPARGTSGLGRLPDTQRHLGTRHSWYDVSAVRGSAIRGSWISGLDARGRISARSSSAMSTAPCTMWSVVQEGSHRGAGPDLPGPDRQAVVVFAVRLEREGQAVLHVGTAVVAPHVEPSKTFATYDAERREAGAIPSWARPPQFTTANRPPGAMHPSRHQRFRGGRLRGGPPDARAPPSGARRARFSPPQFRVSGGNAEYRRAVGLRVPCRRDQLTGLGRTFRATFTKVRLRRRPRSCPRASTYTFRGCGFSGSIGEAEPRADTRRTRVYWRSAPPASSHPLRHTDRLPRLSSNPAGA